MNYVKHPTLAVGDRVRCLKTMIFVTGCRHLPNDILEVEEDTLAFYQLFTDNKHYEKV